MTDNEIIKALECMLGKYSVGEQMNCTGCVFETQGLCCENASEGIVKVALDLINRLQAEIERLNGYINTNCLDCAGCTQWKCDCSNIRAEAVKEFAEVVKTELERYGAAEDCLAIIDNLVEKRVCDDNGALLGDK